jgi:hypothetical protein
MTRRLVTYEEATVATKQHHKPCSDCPWARTALAGWLGDMTPQEWLQSAHGENLIECHTLLGAQCAGSAIYRANVCKSPRNPHVIQLPKNTQIVFASPTEFKQHHIDKKGSL